MIRSVDSITICVSNQAEAVRFYKDVLGFEVRRWEPLGPAGSWIEMGPPGSQTSCLIYPRDALPDWQTRQAFIIFGCDNIQETFESLAARGVVFTQEPTSLGWGIMALFNDPDGNSFGLMQVTRAPRGPAAPPPPAGRRPGGPPPPPPPPR
jgi:lactoylglutathione lyase